MGSHDVFEILFREHATMLSVYLRAAVRDPAAEDEIFQQSMITAWKTLDRFDRSRPFGPWLRGIAAHHVMAWRRTRRRDHAALEAEMLDRLASVAAAIEARPGDVLDDRLTALSACIEQLPAEGREAIWLRYSHDLDGEAMANRLAISVEAVKKRVQRARAKLADCLTRTLGLGTLEVIP
ncbi:MAG: sigma-70 family RNA polymerase sigma factor [Planctomycetota bacterium]